VTDRLLADRPSSDRPVAEKKDPMVVPAPAPMPAAPAAPSTKPSAEPKAAAKPAAPEAKAEAKRAPDAAKGQSAMAVTEKPTKPSTPKPSAAAKPEAAPKAAAAQPASKRVVAKATGPAATTGGPYWVQIGAFKDAESAKRIAAKLREENFKVEESIKRVGGAAPAAGAPAAAAGTPPSAPAGTADQYDVFVTGMSAEELNRRLAGKGLASESSSGGGLVVKPSLPLRDAVALSKDLAVEGFKVQVRRAGAAASAPAVVSTPTPSPTPGTGEGGQTLHRVRVGAFTDRAAALAAARELESKGFKPYIARGDQ
jgi:cell division septation protein DedD